MALMKSLILALLAFVTLTCGMIASDQAVIQTWFQNLDYAGSVQFDFGSDLCSTGSAYFTCDGEGYITDINIGNVFIMGTVPIEFVSLSRLASLYLGGNYLYGTIPTQYGTISNLASLNLVSNSITGTIPTELAVLPLTSLLLTGNLLTGTIPAQLNSMTAMNDLELDGNQLVGPFPDLSTVASLGGYGGFASNLFCPGASYSYFQSNDQFFCGTTPYCPLETIGGAVYTRQSQYTETTAASCLPKHIGAPGRTCNSDGTWSSVTSICFLPVKVTLTSAHKTHISGPIHIKFIGTNGHAYGVLSNGISQYHPTVSKTFWNVDLNALGYIQQIEIGVYQTFPWVFTNLIFEQDGIVTKVARGVVSLHNTVTYSVNSV